MPTPLQIRSATSADAQALAHFATHTFIDTYSELDDPHELAAYCAEHFTLAKMQALIADATRTTLLGEVGAALAGYAVVAASATPDCVTGPHPIELARLYFARGFIGHGHGAQMMRAVHREARQRGAQTLWLSVYDRNTRAVAFYERFGFRPVGGKVFSFGGRDYVDPVYAAPVRG